MTAQQKYELWLNQVPKNTPMYDELLTLKDDAQELEERFGTDLTFGTAGLRGTMGAGTNKMNIYTVRRAALAYGKYIKEAPELSDTCAIAYDTRNNGVLFSQTCAAALAEQGIHVYIFSEPTPTPVLSFAVRHLKTGGGVVMTASHNPAAYNGMKCYGNDGCQQTDEPAARVFELMQEITMISEAPVSFDEYVKAGQIELIYDEVFTPYYEAVLGELICKDIIPVSGVKILYTPLHGTGLKPVTTLMKRIGADFDVVESQAVPDGNFPTCPYPNPETSDAFNEVRKVIASTETKYDIVIATDPDADRVAVAVPVYGENGAELVRLSGNELGSMLLEFILNNRLRQGNLPEDSRCIKSIVTTPMVKRIAAQYGCTNIDVLTGFKYIGSTILAYEQMGKEDKIVFAFEESCGFLKGTYARDKDSQIAAVLVCALAAACKLEGYSVAEKMTKMYQKYGFYKNKVISVNLNGEAGKRQCADFINSLRAALPTEIGGKKILTVADYLNGVETYLTTGEEKVLDFPSSNVLAFNMKEGIVILRPSGTEPKLKIYYFAVDEVEETAFALLDVFSADIDQKMHDFGIA